MSPLTVQHCPGRVSALPNGALSIPTRLQRRGVGGMCPSLRELFSGAAQDPWGDWFRGSEVFYTHTARTAIEHGIALLGLKTGDGVLVPSYHCGSEVDVLLNAGIDVQLFRITSKTEIDFADLSRRLNARTRAVYVIHYFGFPQDIAPIAGLCREKGLFLIEDCALSLLTQVKGRRLGVEGDIAVYNFPKTVPVPDGGVLAINSSAFKGRTWFTRRPGMLAVGRPCLSFLKQFLLRLAPWSRGSVKLGENAPETPARLTMPEAYYFNASLRDLSASRLTRRLLKSAVLSDICSRRRHNFEHLQKRLAGSNSLKPLFTNLPQGVCPLFFPVLTCRARAIARKLRSFSIPAIAWWAGYHRGFRDFSEFSEAAFLKDNLLALPIHPQLWPEDLDFIAALAERS